MLNEVRQRPVGIPLTIQQYNRLTPEVLISRLTCRDLHLLALRICALLKLKPERVLVHWASEKVKLLAPTQASDEEIADTIHRRLQTFPRVSFLEVAAAAYQMGRRRLATIVLDMETHAADQVPLLLSMQEDELALQRSINSEDTDLIYLVLIHLERSRPDIENFYRLVHAHPEASNLLKMYYRCKVNLTPTLTLTLTLNLNLTLHSLPLQGRGRRPHAAAEASHVQQAIPRGRHQCRLAGLHGRHQRLGQAAVHARGGIALRQEPRPDVPQGP